MFQYALGRALSLRHHVPFKLDIAGYEHISGNKYSMRYFELPHFSVIADIATKDEIRREKYPLGKLSWIWRGIRARTFRDRNVSFIPRVLNRKDGYIDGFWQSERYFIEYAEQIRSDFEPAEPLSPPAEALAREIAVAPIAISLHVRRGDNAHNVASIKKFGMPDLSYYESAPSAIAERLGTRDLRVFVFSDDIAWARDTLRLSFPVTYASQEGIADWEELVLMSRCAHHVIANSTFSWWAAWLNPSPTKIVIAPLHWVNVGAKAFAGIVPASWIRM
jgi:hypothetical protein